MNGIHDWFGFRDTQREQRVIVEVAVACTPLDLEEFADQLEHFGASAGLDLFDFDINKPLLRLLGT